ncbi:leucyl/phenylalanyl-tRNA--protein transferase [Piscirickettsia salmonis]|uniref:Leucyl/phenylalanyl-tRNA--protein transferase n=2 Tax=Piscirickettsia salmonis TaxID=1238 RepID=A0A9Q6LTG8_PISSA|nr:leucyl/phenylalanyl-tRNA--protein transferase [Piscirickettsia salmonis]ALA24472.1 leucyl/phenylalanyl-tRNA--protein transferase [Piscirickettsia salmonis]APS48190.1 leucyl/phenylalanyl-tRNA--protein transferase [Piscirickettsia salmonis]APS49460.1 leucyl/phenylalanyl-tRNA--protein transferase [Piscirickettsia salmonis]APS52636.1 leucyl/phenylalanyl-tRNA--protein transferase [Piscirickettsia salmonis]APS56550.1 leucyl/phenylalanyl-tRNA--protein transferase [Piscirickettsia salmonis]
MNLNTRLPFLLDLNRDDFPSPEQALTHPDGLLAIGGDLSPTRLIKAYYHGIFPWFTEEDPILWWSPSLRAVLAPSDFHLSRSLKKLIKKQAFQVTVNQCFNKVIDRCAKAHAHQGTWITATMIHAYTQLHRAGHAHSIEVWQDQQLVGGLYGVSTGGIFSGESMFQCTSNASKVAFAALIALLKSEHNDNGVLIDCQLLNPHLATLGVHNIARTHYLHLLEQYRDKFHLKPTWAQANKLITNALTSLTNVSSI